MTMQHYNHTAKLYLAGTIDFANVAAMLLNDTAVFNAADDDILDVAGVAYANEVSGNGWTLHGEILAMSFLTTNTNYGIADADDVSKLATGGNIGPAYKCCIYDKTSGKPLHFDTFASSRVANDGTNFILFIPATGIMRIRPPS